MRSIFGVFGAKLFNSNGSEDCSNDFAILRFLTIPPSCHFQSSEIQSVCLK